MYTEYFVMCHVLVEDIDTLNSPCGRFAVLLAIFQREKLFNIPYLAIGIKLNDTVKIEYAAILNMNAKHIKTGTNVWETKYWLK